MNDLKNHSMKTMFQLAESWNRYNLQNQETIYSNGQIFITCEAGKVHITDKKTIIISVALKPMRINMTAPTDLTKVVVLLRAAENFLNQKRRVPLCKSA